MSRLELRPLSLDHIDHVMTWVNKPEVVKNFQKFDHEISRDEELEFLRKLIASETDWVYSVFRVEDGAYVGQVGLNQISWENRLGRLSAFVVPEMGGQGYGTEAIKLLLEKAFGEHNLNKAWLMVYAENVRSQGIYERIGFTREGLLRQEYLWNGKKHDIVRMGMLAEEYSGIKAGWDE